MKAGGMTPLRASAADLAALVAYLNSLGTVRGQSVFADHSCATCHGVNGIRGTWAAPALANTGKNFPPAPLITLLQHPTARMRQGGMPPVALRPDELNALAAYVAFISASKPASTPTPR
jgi:mono/diheme cytochrome c family protein